ncbi:MAG: anti-sigma factor family protein [Aquabacterium sp.]
MNAPETPDEAMLSAWLDGELPADETARVDLWLQEHPQDAARVRQWAADRDALQARFDPVLHEQVPARLASTLRPRDGLRQAWRQAAMAGGLLVAGGLIGAVVAQKWMQAPAQIAGAPAPGSADGDWPRRAAVAHVVYVPEVRYPVDVNVLDGDPATLKAKEQHLARWLTRRLNMPVRLFDLTDKGFLLMGGRLLPDARGPSAQLMYRNADNLRVTVYLRRPDDATPAAFRYEREGDLGMFYWVEGGSGYALVGNLPREQLLTLSDSIYSQTQAAIAAERAAAAASQTAAAVSSPPATGTATSGGASAPSR